MYDKETAKKRFGEILKYKTVAGFDDEFIKLQTALKEMYPLVYEKCEPEIINGNGLMFRWKGKISEESIILAAHYDVVPADDHKNWKYPPFSGTFADGKIWGRGTLDTKCTFCAVLECVEAQIKSGFVPRCDVYICFGGDEETYGKCAIAMADALNRRGVKPFLVLDEGGAVVDGSMAGINHKCALIGIAEKGYMDVQFTVKGTGGHSSAVGAVSPVSVMAEVVQRIESNIFKPNITEPLKIMIEAAKKYVSFKYRAVLNTYNIWRKIGFIKKQILKQLPEIKALTRTTGAITRINGGNADNSIPDLVTAVGNFRIINSSSVSETLDTIKETLKDLPVEIKILEGLEPSPISDINSKGFAVLSLAVNVIWEDVAVIPYLMFARSDSRSYSEISNGIYRFSPIMMTKEQRNSIHGINENITEDDFFRIIDFYICLVEGL